MRTTVTLDDDVARGLEQLQHDRQISFREAINSALRQGLGRSPKPRRYKMKTYPMGLRPGVNLDKALQVAAELEDQEIIHKLQLGK
jgi:hypothetical protein